MLALPCGSADARSDDPLNTYQHHLIDVPAGLAVAALCIALTPPRRVAAGQPVSMRRVQV